MNRILLLVMMQLLLLQVAGAAVVEKTVAYFTPDQTEMESFVAFDDAAEGKLPAVLIVHAWRGIQNHEKDVARRLAGMGYVGFAVDVYGRGVRPEAGEAAGKQSGRLKGDRALLRERLDAGLEQLKKMPNVDPEKIVAIGYCFGGTAVLELARAGAPVKGVVSFHGGLDTQEGMEATKIDTKILVLHGAVDPAVPQEQVDAFLKEMEAVKADYQMIFYGGQVHAFTEKSAQSDRARYDEQTDKRSWKAFEVFLEEVI